MEPTPEEAQIARTESVFRSVNERIAETAQGVEGCSTVFVCECADVDCQHRLHVPLHEYEEVRQEPTHFLVAEGHELPHCERVLKKRCGYEVIQKFKQGMAAIVRRTDPRADTV